ncbi:TPA: hypothetical protein DHU97_00795 [Candidatus Saccharibacteria bacterium]|nr:hypothetical protein [Candidatus Saccharibacteria bacterium]
MRLFHDLQSPELIAILKRGGIGILRTDTLYGVVACADDETAVNRVYELRSVTIRSRPSC